MRPSTRWLSFFLFALLGCKPGPTPPIPPTKAEPPPTRPGQLSEDEIASLFSRLPPLPEVPSKEKSSLTLPPKTPPRPEGAVTQMALNFSPGSLPSAPKVTSLPLQVTRVSPEGEIGPQSEISISFSQPMVPLGSPEKNSSSLPVSIIPSIVGKWRWQGTQLLTFQSDTRLPMATTFTVEIPAGTRSQYEGELKESRRFSFSTNPVRLIDRYPKKYPNPLRPVLLLAFDQRIKPKEIAALVQVEAKKKLFKTRLATDAEINTQKELVSFDYLPDTWIALIPEEDLPFDAEVKVTLPVGTPSAEGPRKTSEAQSYTFRTYGPLKVAGHGCQEGCYEGEELVIWFDDALDAAAFDPKWVKVSPSLPGLKTEVKGSYLYLKGDTKAGKTYTVSLSSSLRGSFGQTMSKDESIKIEVIPEPPVLKTIGETFLVVDSVGGTFLPIASDQVSSLKVKVYQVKPEELKGYAEYLQKLNRKKSATPPGTLAFSKTITVPKAKEPEIFLDSFDLDLSSVLPKGSGSVLVEIDPIPAHKHVGTLRAWVQFTKLSLETFYDNGALYASVTSLETGAPISGAEVSFYPGKQKATTDKDGLAKLPLSSKGDYLLLAKKGDESAFLPSDTSWIYDNAPGSYYYNYDETEELPSIEPYNIWRAETLESGLRWYLASDRSLYRPGEEAQIKGWLRRIDRGPKGDVALEESLKTVSYSAKNQYGNEIASGTLSLSRLGGFSVKVPIPESAPLGSVSISFSADSGLGGSQSSLWVKVREFRRPEFEVTAKAPMGPLFAGEPAAPSVRGAYYSGGGLPDAFVRWELYYKLARFTPPNRSDFFFGPVWESSSQGLKNATLEGKTDKEGTHTPTLTLPKTLVPWPYTVQAEATLQDLNRQAWTDKVSWMVHPSSVYVGMRTDKYYYFSKDPIQVEAIVVGLDGEIREERALTIEAKYYGVKPITGTPTNQLISTQSCTLRSTKELSRCSFENQGDGVYRISATVTDEKGRPNISQLSVYVFDSVGFSSSANRPPEPKLFADKAEYKPGDTAELLLLAPMYPVEAVITQTRDEILSIERRTITEPVTRLSIPITEQRVSGVGVSVSLTTQNKEGSIEALPEFFHLFVELKVSAENRRLSVKVSPEAQRAQPGEKTTLTLTVKNNAGRVVPGAEVALVVVDEAILAIADDYRLPDPLPGFYPMRDLSIGGETLRDYAQLVLRGTSWEREFGSGLGLSGAGYGGGGSFGAKGSSSGPPPVNARSDYRPLAYFQGELLSDEKGEVKVSFTLPDTLTRYRVMALAATEQRFGQGEGSITAGLPLMVRPSPPRFLRAQDSFELPVLVQNQTDTAIEVKVAARASGLTLTGEKAFKVKVPAQDRVEVRFPGLAAQTGQGHLQVIGASETYADAALLSLPIYSPATLEDFATYGQLDGDAVIAQPIDLPKEAVLGYGGLQVTASSTALSGLSDALLYLTRYPYECSEQLASRVIAVSSLRDVLGALSSESLPSNKEIEEAMQRDIKKLAARQNSDGSFGLWKKDDISWPFLNVYVSLALALAKEEGFSVPEETIQQAKTYLMRLMTGKLPAWYENQDVRIVKAYSLYARKLLGDDTSRDANLFANLTKEENLSTEEAALYLATLSGAGLSEEERLKRSLYNKVSETASTAQLNTATSESGGYLLLHSARRTDALGLIALISSAPQSEVIPKLVAGLLGQRKGGRWLSTQENAWVLLALKRYFDTYEKTPPDFTLGLWLGESFQGEASFSGYNPEKQRLEIPLEELQGAKDLLFSKRGAGRLYYRLGLSYLLPVERLGAASFGFAVDRSYEAIDQPEDVRRDADGVLHIRAGARVKVRVTMNAPSRRYHVALVDPLPAGLEAQDPSLTTTASSSKGSGAVVVRGYSGLGGSYFSGFDWYLHRAFRDERVESFSPALEAGVYELSYVALATTPGRFVAPPAKAEEMYSPETFGRSAGLIVVVE